MAAVLSSFSTIPRLLVAGLICVLALVSLPFPTYAEEITARFMADYGNVTVMEVTGNFDENTTEGAPNVAPRQAVAREFFRTHKDEYDFVTIFTNFDFKLNPNALAFYNSVKNDVGGIGKEIFDFSSLYGSNARLQGTIDMGNLHNLVTDPLNAKFEFTIDTLIHEMQHRWGAYLKFKDWNGSESSALLGYQASHWSFLFDSGGSTHMGNRWQNNGDGTFTSIAVRKYYSPLDLYLMGMIDKSKVPPTLLIENQAINPSSMPELGSTISGTARYVNIDDIIAVEGERTPTAGDSQKQFRMAFIYVVVPGTFKADDLPGIENVRNGYLTRYSILTDGKGLVQVTSTPREELPANPGVHPPATVPRTLPPNINDGLNWLVSHQQTDGSWTDFALTTERDTAESVATLQIFPTAQNQFQAGLNWLGTNASNTTDYLTRGIEARVHAGGDSSSQVQELLSRRNSDGGWGGGRNFVSSPTDTALALKSLAAAGYNDRSVVGQAVAYLQATQNPDGGWSGDSSASIIQPTAAVLSAYNSYRKMFDLEAGIGKGAAFLIARQNPDGGFGNSPSTVYDSSLALMALQAVNGDLISIASGVSYLLNQQSQDGSWNESPFQTALAMRAVWQATVDPDLSVKAEDASIIPATITALPTNAVLSATIRNLGRSDVSQARVALYEGSIAPDHKLAEQILAFPGQSAVTVTFSIPVTSASGHVYHVVADPDNQLAESNKNNNSAAKALLPEITYDFQIQASDITIEPNPADIGKDVKISLKVANRGTSDAYSVPVRIFIDQPGAPLEVAQLSVDIPSGVAISSEVTWRAGLAGANLPLTVQIDPNATFSETNKDNNSAAVPLTVNASTLPNLSVSYRDMLITPSPAREGGSASISVLVKNDGFSTVGNVNVSVYKGAGTNDRILLGNRLIPVIAAGQSVQTAVDWTGISEYGERIISVQVDQNNNIQEIAKDDNFAFTTLDILSLPDLAISTNSVAINPATPKISDLIAVAVTVQNAGGQEARDITVQLKESGAVIGSTVIPLINGNSQATGTIVYTNSGQTGSHQISVAVDPDSSIIERTKENNSAVKILSIQDDNLWLSNPYISPNGDGIKDSTDFSFRMSAPTKITVQVVNNNKSEVVRTFSRGDLDNTTGTTITWDGKSDTGSVVDDGNYLIRVVGPGNEILASMFVEVDTNRSPLTDAIGTKYLLTNNLSCQIPSGSFSNWTWLPFDSGILFDNLYAQQGFLPGTYRISPMGDDIWKITVDDWSDNAYDYEKDSYSVLSPDGLRFAFVIIAYNRADNQYSRSLWVQNVDGRDLRRIVENVPGYMFDIVWSQDSKRVSYVESLSFIGDQSLYTVDADSGIKNLIHRGYTWNSVWSADGISLAFETNTQCETTCTQVNPTLMIYKTTGEKTVVYESPDSKDFSIRWLADGKLLLESGLGPVTYLIVDSQHPGAPIEAATLSGKFAMNPQFSISPDGRRIAFIEQNGEEPDLVTQSLKITDLNGGNNLIGDIGLSMITNCEGPCLNTPNLLWFKDSSKLAFVAAKFREVDNQIDENLSVYDLGTGLINSTNISTLKALTSSYNGNPAAETPINVFRLVDWLEDEISILLDTAEGYFALNTSTGLRSVRLPISTNNFWNDRNLNFSRGLKYLVYHDYADSSAACVGDGGVWTLSSLLNLTADLKITKNKSSVKLKGIASDKNLAGYKLEFADIRTPDIWNLVMPPSDVPVVNDLFTDWVPPSQGSYYVRLTAWDKAGNTAVTRQRVMWGLASGVTNLYLSRGLISPNNDGVNDTVELNYRVLEPAHLEFSVIDAAGKVIQTFVREYADPTSNSLEWNGKDESGRFVPDGKYVIKLFDYEFPVEVDTTPPDVALAISSPWRWWSFMMPGHAVDKNLKEWNIRFGEGENPSEWHEFKKGTDQLAGTDNQGLPVLTPNIQDINLVPDPRLNNRVEWPLDEVISKTGMRFRITATDFAGNISSNLTEVMPEALVVYLLNSKGLGDKINLTNLKPGPQIFQLFETIRASLASTRLQYKLREIDLSTVPPTTKYTWVASSTSVSEPSGKMNILWNPTSTPVDAVAIRFVATSVNNLEYLSNEVSLVGRAINPTVPANTKCEITFGASPVISDCDLISGEIIYGISTPIDATRCKFLPQLKKVNMFVVRPDGAEQLLKSYSEGQPEMSSNSLEDSMVTTGYPEGKYKLKAEIDYIDFSTGIAGRISMLDDFIVDRVLPEGAFQSPSPGELVCPVTIGTDLYDTYAVDVEGTLSDNVKTLKYDLEYGIGENPEKWQSAMTRVGYRITKPYQIVGISGIGPVNGQLGYWDVTELLGKTVSTRMRVTDIAGNTHCINRSYFIRNRPELTQVATDKKVFASLNDKLNISYVLKEELTVSVEVYYIGDKGQLSRVSTLSSGVLQGAGLHGFEWNGRDSSGSLLRDGKYQICISVTSACGFVVSDGSIVVEIDNTAPETVLTYPLAGDPIPLGNTIEVTGTSYDHHFFNYKLEAGEGEKPASWSTIKSGQTPVSTSVLGVWNTYGMGGIWTLRLTTADLAGNESSAISVFDLGVHKELVKSLKVTPDLISPNRDQKLDTSTISYEVSAACNVKIEIMDQYHQVLKTITAVTAGAENGSYVWDGKTGAGSLVPDGTFIVRLVASLATNPQITQTETLSLVVDTTPPALSILEPAENAFLNKTEISVVGTIDDPNLTGYNILFAGPSSTITVDSGIQNRMKYRFGNMAALAEDTYAITVGANDKGENNAKLIRTFTIDRTAPKVTLDAPKSGEFYGAGQNVIGISGAIVEKNLERYSLRYGVGESPTEFKELAGGDSVPAVSGLSSWKVGKDDGITDGIYTLFLYAKDKAGLEGETKVKLVVDNTLPEVAVTLPKDGGYLSNATDIKGTLNDTNLDKGLLELAEGGCATASRWAVVKTITTSVQNGVLDSWKLLPTDGEYCLRASATDKSGNKAETKIGIKIDTHPPATPQLAGHTENKATNSLSWTKSPEPDVASYNVYRNGQKLNTTPITDHFYSETDLKEGSYSYTVKAADLAGNESTPSNVVTLKIDRTGPTVRISTPKDGAAVANLVDIKGTAFSQNDFKEYRVYIGQGSMPSSWTLVRQSPLPISYGSLAQWDTIPNPDGSKYSLKLEGEDTSGNIATTQTIVTIDNSPPKSPVLLTAVATAADVALSWKANTDTDLAGYLLYRNDQLANVTGIVAGSMKPYLVTGTNYTDKALPDGTYRYYLVAMDQAENSSDQSNLLEVSIDTHPPHVTIPEPQNGQRFESKIMIKAESPDNDIASVRFLYKRAQDSTWVDIGTPFTKTPYVIYFDPKSMGLAYDDYQLKALAIDRGGKPDPAPPVVTLTYTDVTPPEMPSGLSAKVNGADVNLTWNAVGEAGVRYNIYRWNSGTRARANSVPVMTAAFVDSGVPVGTYQYEITAMDVSGNESKASEQALAKIYAPIIIQPFTPVKEPALNLAGNGADPNSAVEITIVLPTGDSAKVTVIADASGSFKLEGITLAPGESNFTAVTSDSNGNISKNSETVYVAYGEVPAVPTGLVSTTLGKDVTLNWDASIELDILGFYVYRNGYRLNGLYWIEPIQVLASDEDYILPAVNAIDDNYGTYWSTTYSNDGTFTPAWIQITLPGPELISELDLEWYSEWDYSLNKQILYAGKDFEVQAWTGHAWVTIKKILENGQASNELLIDPPYRTDRLRLVITATTDLNASKQIKLIDAYAVADDIDSTTSYNDTNRPDGKYLYEVSAVNQHGFISGRAATTAKLGHFPQAPDGLVATVQGSNVSLVWNSNPASDSVYYYNLQRWDGQEMVGNWWINSENPAFSDYGIENGSYRYRVSALAMGNNGWLESDFSNDAFATVAAIPPSAPFVPSVTSLPEGKALKVSWQPVTGANHYSIYRGINGGGPYTRVATGISSLSYVDNGLVNGITYFYVITASDGAGNESVYSGEANGIPGDLVAQAPVIFQPTVPGTPVTVHEDRVKVSGFAEPGSQVTVFRGDLQIGSTLGEPQDIHSDRELVLSAIYFNPSPDGSTLAYLDSDGNLILQNLQDSSLTTISTAGELNYPFEMAPPKWSPNGRYLILQGNDYQGNDRVVIYDRVNDEMRAIVTGTTSYDNDPAWSPGGDAIIFVGDGDSIWLANPVDGATTRITGVGNYVNSPALSPDGTRVAFYDDSSVLNVFNRSDSSFTQLDDENDGENAVWSPNGSRLAFISYRDGNGDVYTYAPADGSTTRRTSRQQDGYNIVWSPDGAQLGFASYTEDVESYWIVDINGHERKIFEANGGIVASPEWRTDGTLNLIDNQGIHSITPAGYFSLPQVNLIPGENNFSAIEIDEAGNVSNQSDYSMVVFDSGGLPDLVLNDRDVILFPPYPKPGEEVLLTARVRNTSNNSVGNVTVDLYLWDGSGDVALIRSESIPGIVANGDETVSARFVAGTDIGAGTIIAVVDPANLIQEVVETNNHAARDLVVTDQERVSISSSISSSQFGANQDASFEVTLMNSGSPTSGTLKVMVEDSNGNIVKLITSQPQDLPYALNQKLAFSWNTGGTYAGSYKLHVLVTDEIGTVTLAESAKPFSILPDIKASGSVTTDKQSYGPGENTVVNVSFNNSGVNHVMPQLKVRLQIVDSGNTRLFSEEKDFTNLLPAMGGSFTSVWNTGLLPAGAYAAVMDLFAEDKLLESRTAVFNILPQPLLKGGLTLDMAAVLPGRGFIASYSIANHGNSAAAGTVRVTLQDPDGQAMVASSEQPAAIQVNDSMSGSVTFDTTGLATRTYQVVLSFRSDAAWQSIAMATIAVKDGMPPTITIVSPLEGTSCSGDVSLSVIANDDFSGVDKVEYSIDNGAWKVLPLADASRGRYSSSWTPDLTGNGSHSVSFRGIDRAGNISHPVSVNFDVQYDTMAPILTLSTLASGSYTNNEVLNISGTVSDNVAVRELLINGAFVPFNPDGSFSHALILADGSNTIEVTATDLAANPVSDIRTIYLDQIAPLIDITSPADNSKTGKPEIIVSGNVDETSSVEVSLNGVAQPSERQGDAFKASLTPVYGPNTIEVIAVDLAMNKGTEKRTITFDDQKPSLAITEPGQDIHTNRDVLILKGTVADTLTSVSVSIEMDGAIYTPEVTAGGFEQRLVMVEEKSYAVNVTATDEVGNSIDVRRNVIYDITSPVLTIAAVVSPTIDDSQVVSGAREPDSVVVVSSATAVIADVTYPSATTWQVIVADLKPGSNILTASTTDSANNVTTVSKEIFYTASTSNNIFSAAIFGGSSVTMTGNSYTDSYINGPSGWIRGKYKNGDVGTNSLQPCGIKMSGGAQVFGKVWVGQDANPALVECINGGSSVSGGSGALAVAKDMTPKTDPAGGTAIGAIKLSGHGSKTLTAGDYRISTININGNSTLNLSGPMTLHVDGNFSLSGNSSIVVTSGDVTIYQNGRKLQISGGSIVNTNKTPASLIIYGTAGLQAVSISGNADLYALVHAPTAAIKLSGGQNTFGSIIGNTVDISGGSSVHYDEGLNN